MKNSPTHSLNNSNKNENSSKPGRKNSITSINKQVKNINSGVEISQINEQNKNYIKILFDEFKIEAMNIINDEFISITKKINKLEERVNINESKKLEIEFISNFSVISDVITKLDNKIDLFTSSLNTNIQKFNEIKKCDVTNVKNKDSNEMFLFQDAIERQFIELKQNNDIKLQMNKTKIANLEKDLATSKNEINNIMNKISNTDNNNYLSNEVNKIWSTIGDYKYDLVKFTKELNLININIKEYRDNTSGRINQTWDTLSTLQSKYSELYCTLDTLELLGKDSLNTTTDNFDKINAGYNPNRSYINEKNKHTEKNNASFA